MKALCASILSLVLLNSAMGQPCVGCSLVCVAATQGAADCDICSPNACAVLIDTAENLNADCNTCLNSDDTGCDGRVLTETNLLVCETYCEFDVINDKCNLIDTMDAGYCNTNCEMSTTLTDCENNCDNQDCLWTGNTVCECNCDCTTGVDECRAGDGCATDYICGDDAVENGRCACRLECGIDNGDACDLLNCPAECVANEGETACECAVVDCSNNTDCGGVDCTDTDQICDENVAEPPSGCICVPDCQATTECNEQTCDHECVLNGEKTACECSPLTCEDKTDCNPSCDAHHICETSSGVCECRLECDVNQNDEACGGACGLGEECQENVEMTGCMCVPDCEAASQCDDHACDSGEECKLTDDKISCECMGLSTTAAESTTSDGSVLHASATVCIVAALYSVSV